MTRRAGPRRRTRRSPDRRGGDRSGILARALRFCDFLADVIGARKGGRWRRLVIAPPALALGLLLGYAAAVAHTGRVVDERGLDFATQRGFDSYVPTLYNDPANCTIGYGHLVHLGPCVFNRPPSGALGGAGAYARQLDEEMPYLNQVNGKFVKREDQPAGGEGSVAPRRQQDRRDRQPELQPSAGPESIRRAVGLHVQRLSAGSVSDAS